MFMTPVPGGKSLSGKGVFEDVFGKLPGTKKLEIIQDAKQNGEWATAGKYFKEIGISQNGLYKRLKKELDKGKEERPIMASSGRRVNVPPPGEVKLTKKEKKFLKGLEDGTASLEEASRLVAVKVFEKMFRNPGNVKFLDFFRTELLKIKKMEAETKKTWAMQLVGRMFGGGELPPPVCPKCNHVLVKGGEHILEGDIIGDAESIPNTETS